MIAYVSDAMEFAAPRSKPADRHATWAFLVLQKDKSTQMVPYDVSLQTSTLPAESAPGMPVSLTSPAPLQKSWPKMRVRQLCAMLLTPQQCRVVGDL